MLPRALTLALATVAVSASVVVAANYDSASEVLDDVSQRGPKSVVKDLWSDREQWAGVMRHVASGQTPWLKVAVALKDGTDAGASTELHDAVFAALRQNPASVLRQATVKFPVHELCVGRSDPLETFNLAASEQNAVIKAVRAVRDEDLKAQRTRCLARLNDGKANLRRFFGK